MTKLKQTQEALKTVSDKKEQLILKYQWIIDKLNQHILKYKKADDSLKVIKFEISIYTEFINDLKFL